MAWWVIRNLDTGDDYSSDIFPLKQVVKEVNNQDGHKLSHNNYEVTCGNFKADMRGSLWDGDTILARVEDPDRLVMFKRRWVNPQTGHANRVVIFLGITGKNGKVIKIEDGQGTLVPFNVGMPTYV